VGIEGMGGKERKLLMVKERCCDWKKHANFCKLELSIEFRYEICHKFRKK
jgi:hypothetical protein